MRLTGLRWTGRRRIAARARALTAPLAVLPLAFALVLLGFPPSTPINRAQGQQAQPQQTQPQLTQPRQTRPAQKPALDSGQETGWGDLLDRLSEVVVTPEQERRIAESEHPKVLAQFGGEYGDPALKSYVTGLVRTLGQASNRPDIDYRVTILNSPIVNAFALPGGNLYVTRGLLALAGSEAELAGVLAHEIGHVTARHTAQRYGRSLLASSAAGLVGLITDSPAINQAVQSSSQVWLRSFSREQEFQADELGVATMARAGYDPLAMAWFLRHLQQHAELQAVLAGRLPAEADAFDLFATHPRTAERVQRAIEKAGLDGGFGGREERGAYLRRLDGMLYGDDPAQGFVRGREFVHPGLRIRFEVPAGFQLLNGAAAVIAAGPGGATIRFDNAPERFTGTMRAYITERWVRTAVLSGIEALSVNGMDGAAALARAATGAGPVDVRFVAIRAAPDIIYRFQFVLPAAATQLWPEFGKVTASFRRLSAEEAAALGPQRLRLIQAGISDSFDSMAQRMAAPDRRVERFRALNGVKPGEQPVMGRLYKIVGE